MTVRSVPTGDGGRPRKASAILSRSSIARQRGAVERTTALGVLFLSFLGTVVSFHGGWTPLIELRPSLAAILGGILVQFVLTWLQWSYHHNRFLCWGSRGVDTFFTAKGFGPLFVPMIAPLFIARGWSVEPITVGLWVLPGSAFLGAWAIMGLVSLAAAWYPETRLID